MPEATPIERALCCGPTCGRVRPEHGECVASTHGRAQHERLKAAGFDVVAVNSFEHQHADVIAQQKAIREQVTKRRAALGNSNG